VELDDSTRRWQVTALALIATVLAALPVIAASAPAAGDPRDDKKRVDADVARAASILEDATDRARLAAQSYATASGALPSAQERVAETRGEVIAAQVQADSARRDEAEARVTLVAATQRHDQMAHQVDEARDRVGTIVAATYKGGSFVAFGSVLDATTPADLANRIGYLDRIMATQQEAIHGLTTARWQAKEAQNEATLARQRAEAARQAADQALTRARDAQAEAETAVAAVTQLVTQRQDAMRVAEQERGASLARYEEAKAESARVEAELRAWYARLAQQARQRARNPGGSTGGGSNGGGSGDGSGPSLQPGARFLMPVEGWKSSDFGMRYDPYYRVWQLHAGTDFAAGSGQPIYAAADGRVIFASWRGGYGNYTCLSHGTYRGQGLSTCYAHQSQILVGFGQWVRRGQVIGRVGTTGASTGNHLHFEVRLDGTPTNPLRWLPACLC
jgi:murein DD-endopeptidase MepM/ murein hydrolase activator NlpD